MTEKRYIYASVGREYEILDSWFGYIGDEAPTEREIEEYDFLVIGLAPDQDAAEGICRRLNDQQDEINQLSNFGLHVMLDKKNKEIEQLKFKLEKVRNDEKQLGISFIEFKMKLIEKLQIHYNYATEQKQKNLNNVFVAQTYDIIRYDIRKLAEEMGVDLE